MYLTFFLSIPLSQFVVNLKSLSATVFIQANSFF